MDNLPFNIAQRARVNKGGKKARDNGKENRIPPEEEKRAKALALRNKAKQYKPPVPGIPQRTLVLKKRESVSAKPLSFVTNTQLYDEHWIKKQERSKLILFVALHM